MPRCSHPLPSPTSTRGSSDSKESACNVGDPGLIPGLGRCSAEENGYPLQYSCLENAMDRGAWRTTVHGVAKSQTQWSNQHFHFRLYQRISRQTHIFPMEAISSQQSPWAQIRVIISNSNLARLGWAQAPHPTCSHSSHKTLTRSPYPHGVWTRTR